MRFLNLKTICFSPLKCSTTSACTVADCKRISVDDDVIAVGNEQYIEGDRVADRRVELLDDGLGALFDLELLTAGRNDSVHGVFDLSFAYVRKGYASRDDLHSVNAALTPRCEHAGACPR